MNYVIIGNSAAAIGCVEGIRQLDSEGSITIISDEPYHTYSRPLISYLLYGKTDEQRMKYRPDDFYEKNGCKTILGKKTVDICTEKKQAILEDGTQIPYDKLLIATGSRPFVPPIKGLDQVQNQFRFMKLEDAKALEKALTPDSRVLILGAGLIGLKCAEGIRSRVQSLTVVDLAPRILPNVLDEQAASIVQKHLEKHGIEFILSDSVAVFQAQQATLKSGKKVPFDVLVVAVGVRPNTELAAKAGAVCPRGIMVDEHCKTTLTDIYAAGDCTESIDITTGEAKILALLPNAYMQGECAGLCMAGGQKYYNQAIPMNAVGFFELHIITAGNYGGEEYIQLDESGYKKLVTKDNLLKGYILVGQVERAGIYTALIRERTPLDTIDFELIKQKPQLMAFSKVQRAEKLGGAKI